jgi:hypothetical protein
MTVKLTKGLTLFALCLMVIGVGGGYYAGAVNSANQVQYQKFINAQGLIKSTQDALLQANPVTVSNSSGFYAVTVFHAVFFVGIHYGPSHGYSANQTLVKQGYTPDCLQWCWSGINYFMDPTTLITSQGRGVEQCSVFQGTGVTDTCTTTNKATYLGTSLDTHTPAAGDTWAGGATIPCSSTNLIVDANGLRDVAATVTAGANGATVSTTLAKTFSITGTYTSAQVSCVISGTGTNADSGTNPLIYAEGTYGPDTFHTGDSLTYTWVIART